MPDYPFIDKFTAPYKSGIKTRGEANNPVDKGPLKIHKILKFIILSWVNIIILDWN